MVLVIHTDGHDIRFARMVEEAADIPVEIGVDAVIGCAQVEEVAVVGATIGLGIGENLTRVFRHECAPKDLRHCMYAQSFHLVIALEHLQSEFRAILNHTILAQQSVATAHVIAFENHCWVLEIEVNVESPFRCVPVLNGYLAALTVLGGTTEIETERNE